MSAHLPALADAIAFVVIVIALSLGYLWWEARRAPLLDDPRADFDGLHTMPCLDAAAAVLVDELMAEIEEALS